MIHLFSKKQLLIFGISFLLFCSDEVSCQKTDPQCEKRRIEQSIRNSIGWAKNKDFKLLYSVIANDTTYQEVQPGKRIVKGFQEFRKAEKFWGDTAFVAIRYEIRDLQIHISACGDVAWFFCLLDDINQWQGQPANWENTRWTGVLEKRQGNWILVQSHFSFADR